MSDEVTISASKFRMLAEAKFGVISANEKCASAYDRVKSGTDDRSKRRNRELFRYFQEFCCQERHRLNDKQFKAEGKFPDGKGGSVQVYEFKAWQIRFYGGLLGHKTGRRWFVAVDVDEDKKKDKADRKKLRNAALLVGKLSEYRSVKATKSGKK